MCRAMDQGRASKGLGPAGMLLRSEERGDPGQLLTSVYAQPLGHHGLILKGPASVAICTHQSHSCFIIYQGWALRSLGHARRVSAL